MNTAEEIQRSLGRLEAGVAALTKKMDDHATAQIVLVRELQAHLSADEIRFSSIESQQTVTKTVTRTLMAIAALLGGARLFDLFKAVRDSLFS